MRRGSLEMFPKGFFSFLSSVKYDCGLQHQNKTFYMFRVICLFNNKKRLLAFIY